jgi:ribose 1,5-bisphosphokinase PhnN
MPSPILIAIIGPTCAGKGTLIAHLLERHPDWAAVQVGAEMRRRHPPEFFQGRAAMAETEPEVWEIFRAQWQAAADHHAPVVLVDGQPRHPNHPAKLAHFCPQWQALALTASPTVLLERSEIRDETPGQKLLTRARIGRDLDELHRIQATDIPLIATVHTEHRNWLAVAAWLVSCSVSIARDQIVRGKAA